MGVHAYASDVERKLMAGELTDNQARALLAEGLRAELERIIALQDAADLRGDEEIDARIAELKEENRTLRRLARRNEFDTLNPWIANAAQRVGAIAPSEIDPDMGRRAAKLRRSLCDVEIAVLEGDPVDEAAAEIVRDYSTAAVQEFVRAPVTLSAALAKTRHRSLRRCGRRCPTSRRVTSASRRRTPTC